ncbi:MAG: sigma-54-dependent Fis family transcriptional regulator [Gammaproteobacteria bacterium]|nr:MAG: sigma-54-dependent Fis family transcriptional regulator [Gammaproteobacteria bacterium]
MSERRILLVEDDAGLREALVEILSEAGYAVTAAADGGAAARLLEARRFELLLADVQLPELDGRALLERAQAALVPVPVVLMTAYGTIEQAVAAMREGAADYLVKPFDMEALLETVERIIGRYAPDAAEVVMADPATRRLYALAKRVADSDVSVLIQGESGCGKEVLSRYIHRHSPRAKGPFVAINCAAIPESMLEAVLFGYEKGAFTGAQQRTPGKFELANGGTLLLDEISEMALNLQAKLLRVLQEREVERLGGRQPIALDVRVLATTNRDLREAVREGRFREDLFYRLNVFPLHLPPLRARRGDIVPLAEALIRKHAAGRAPALSEAAAQKLAAYAWPGNVRELENVVQRALVVCGGAEIRPEHLLLEFEDAPAPVPASLDDDLKRREVDLILQALKDGNGSRKRAAQVLGISPRTLRYKLSRLRAQGVDIPGICRA